MDAPSSAKLVRADNVPLLSLVPLSNRVQLPSLPSPPPLQDNSVVTKEKLVCFLKWGIWIECTDSAKEIASQFYDM